MGFRRPDKEIFTRRISAAITLAMQNLFENRHLYQNARVVFSELDKEIAESKSPEGPSKVTSGGKPLISQEQMDDELRKRLNELKYMIVNSRWTFVIESSQLPEHQGESWDKSHLLHVVLPTSKIACNHCGNTVWPHNPIYAGMGEKLPAYDFIGIQSSLPDWMLPLAQIVIIPYQCQSCKKEPLVIMVRREGDKLQIVGRSQFEEIQIRGFIPRKEAKYYSDAVISYNCGRTLAGLFYLRTMIEQYMRRIIDRGGKTRGDNLAKEYSKLLNDEFPRTRISMGKIYDELSDKLHGAKEDASQFRKSLAEIEEHFDLLQHFPLKMPQKGKK